MSSTRDMILDSIFTWDGIVYCFKSNLSYDQGSADRPYNTEIAFISQNEGKSLRKDFQI